MPKKITRITIDNYRSWLGQYEPILLSNGENLLIYGENGSGKSSLFKGVQNFFRSSANGQPAFELNRFAVNAGMTNGAVQIEFTDAAGNPPSNSYTYTVGTGSTNNTNFIRATRNLNSFLDYKHLLSVHFSDPEASHVPDLFSPLIENLLGGLILPATTRSIRSEIEDIEIGLRRNVGSRPHTAAVASVPVIQGALSVIINDVIREANNLLRPFNNNVEIQLKNFAFRLKTGSRKAIDKELEIQVRYAGEVLPNYNYFLNEARLSAMAICFFLASIKSHPPGGADYKILFLDDVFIGLDTSNRIPLLELLRTEFSEFQIFISTYDLYWYEVARDWFEKHMANKWICRELFVHNSQHIAGRPAFDKAISVEGGNLFARALYHLNNTAKPDYPAAANYLRKEAERILKQYIPEVELKQKDENIGEFPDLIMLKLLMNTAVGFLQKINQNDALLIQLKGNSKRLLNPLSHYNPTTPIFKQELDVLVALLPQIEIYLKDLRENVFKESLETHKFLRFKYTKSPTEDIFYEIKLEDQSYKYRDAARTTVHFSDPPVRSLTNYIVTSGVRGTVSKLDRKYDSISLAYTQIHQYIINQPGFTGVARNPNWINDIEYKDDASNWHALNTLLIWP